MANKINNFDLTKELEINQKVDLKIKQGRFKGEFHTQVVDIEDENRFAINAPFKEGKLVKLPVNKNAIVVLRRNNGIYSLPVKVVQRRFDATPILVVELSDNVSKVQERRFFRLEIFEPTEFRVVGQGLVNLDDLEPYDQAENYYKGRVEDISGGGVKLSTREHLSKGDIIELEVSFTELSFDTVFGQVIRVREQDREDGKHYLIGVEFLDLPRSAQEELISWLFAEQRRLRKKGLI